MKQIYTELKDKGLELLAVNSIDDEGKIRDYVRQGGFQFKIGLGKKLASDVFRGYRADTFPMNFLIDSSGNIVFRSVGFDEPGLRKALKQLAIQ